MTLKQVRWAEQHDWYRYSYLDEATNDWFVKVRPSFEGDTETEFNSYQALRNWAGY